MSMKLNPPELMEKNYERYKQELLFWNEITSLEQSKRGIAVALSLPEKSSSETKNIREKVFSQLSIEVLKQDDGLQTLIAFLDKCLAKDKLVDSLEKFEIFEEFKRGNEQSITDFILEFDTRYKAIEKMGMTLPSPILAFKLLKCANISKTEKMLVLTGMDYSEKETLYNQAQSSLKKFRDGGAINDIGNSVSKITIEPTFLSEHEDVLASHGYFKRGNSRGYGRFTRRPQRGSVRNNSYREPHMKPSGFNYEKPMNPVDQDGEPLCHGTGCGAL